VRGNCVQDNTPAGSAAIAILFASGARARIVPTDVRRRESKDEKANMQKPRAKVKNYTDGCVEMKGFERSEAVEVYIHRSARNRRQALICRERLQMAGRPAGGRCGSGIPRSASSIGRW
jgi:hypothetical protein